MAINDIKVRYKKTILGVGWVIINPLLQIGIIGVIFQNFIKVPNTNYFIYLYAGLLPWTFISQSLSKAATSIETERFLIKKSRFDREVIPLSIVLSNLFNLFVSLFLFIPILIFTNLFDLQRLILLPFAGIWIVVITSAVCLFASVLYIRFRDSHFIISAAIMLWFYATPIIYSIPNLPSQYIQFLAFNPLVYPLELFKASFLHTSLPSVEIFFGNLLITAVITFTGIFLFHKESPYFSDRL